MSLHLIPAGEAGEHELRLACPCQPDAGLRWRPDGTYGQVVEHHGGLADDKQSEE